MYGEGGRDKIRDKWASASNKNTDFSVLKRVKLVTDGESEDLPDEIEMKYVRVTKDGAVVDVPVCQNAFMGFHDITRGHLRTIQASLKNGQTSPRDSRGKHQNRPEFVPDEIELLITDHISSFKPQQSHYSIRDNPQKSYLPKTLTILLIYVIAMSKLKTFLEFCKNGRRSRREEEEEEEHKKNAATKNNERDSEFSDEECEHSEHESESELEVDEDAQRSVEIPGCEHSEHESESELGEDEDAQRSVEIPGCEHSEHESESELGEDDAQSLKRLCTEHCSELEIPGFEHSEHESESELGKMKMHRALLKFQVLNTVNMNLSQKMKMMKFGYEQSGMFITEELKVPGFEHSEHESESELEEMNVQSGMLKFQVMNTVNMNLNHNWRKLKVHRALLKFQVLNTVNMNLSQNWRR
ncbi:hypothetical protein ANN_03964 [Periplaneta americana]|uniref:Uncharacterized protein n=1 Tax=Periplaneta americana TaxID=6978 RepID=A0ABQ8T797_PERAM|nr:hypothetical protein ANN_03964 [Periplaneta americana]